MNTPGIVNETKWIRTTQLSEGSLTEQSAYQSTLNIEISEFRFRFYCESNSKCIWLEDYSSDVFLTDTEVLESLQLLVFNHPVLSLSGWKAINIMVGSGAFTLIPEVVFRKEYASRYLQLTQGHPALPASKTNVQLLAALNCYNVYEMPQIWWDFFRDRFALRDLTFSHITSVLALNPPADTTTTRSPLVHACIRENHFIASVFEGGRLILCNRFRFQNAEEATFFYLSCLNELDFLSEGVRLVLSGEITPFSKLYSELSKFTRDISFAKKPEHLTYPSAFDDLPDHRYFALLSVNK